MRVRISFLRNSSNMKLNLTAWRVFALRYRRLLAASLVVLGVWLPLRTYHPGQPVLVAHETLAVGDLIQADDLHEAWLEGSSSADFITDPSQAIGKTLTRTLNVGSALLVSDIRPEAAAADRIIISLPLEMGDSTGYETGSRVHVWSLGDGYVELLSEDGVIASLTNGSAPRVLLSLPIDAEAAAMRAAAVRLALVSHGGEDG